MALKIAGKLEELRKTEDKIKKLQDKKRLLERSIRRDEDEEIVRTLRSLDLDHEELARTLDKLRAGEMTKDDLGRIKAHKEAEYESVDENKGTVEA